MALCRLLTGGNVADNELSPGYLILEDGTFYSGAVFGDPPPRQQDLSDLAFDRASAGELIFNTGMAGYQEILTDPSYSGQIVVMTYPHIGNYGCSEDWNEFGPDESKDANRLKATGLAVRSLYRGPLPSSRFSLESFLAKYNTSGITGIDTRRLTLRIRDAGNPLGIIVKWEESGPIDNQAVSRCVDYLNGYPPMEGRNLVSGIGTPTPIAIKTEGSPHIALVDCGVKAGIIRDLSARGCRITVVPNAMAAEDILSLGPDSVLFSNGPGDPSVLDFLIKTAQSLLGKIPVLGICLGHQIISHALGAQTFKMPFGHHGVNNPVRDETSGAVLITSQNHGFSVEDSELPDGSRVWFRNANDKTVEGFIHEDPPALTVQFHPEASPGPRDSAWIFDKFLEL